jgi:hypothetical protein
MVTEVPTATVENATGDGAIVSGPVPVPVKVAESVAPLAPVRATLPVFAALDFGEKSRT